MVGDRNHSHPHSGDSQDFPDNPVVKTLPSIAVGAGSIPAQRAKFPHAWWPKNQNIKQKQYCNKFIKDFKKINKVTTM